MTDQNTQAQSKPMTSDEIRQVINTKSGELSITSEQQGKPANEFFANDKLPDRMWNQVVYESENGPVLVNREPEPWNERHETRAQAVAEKLNVQIERRGSYLNSLKGHAQELSRASDKNERFCFNNIREKYTATFGADPKTHVEQWRTKRNLPVSNQSQQQDQAPNPEM